jgi:uncharacterized damage-inducible protein DinB
MKSKCEMLLSWLEHEKVSTAKMLDWFNSVPTENQTDPRFTQALQLAAHLAACRENWLDRILTTGQNQTDWWPKDAKLEDLPSRFESTLSGWQAFLENQTDQSLSQDFDFYGVTRGQRWNIEAQAMQMVGHSFYHRAQISLLITQLGGTPEDTDYLYWRIQQEPARWHALELPRIEAAEES